MDNLPSHDIYEQDTLEGRRQADAIEDWLFSKQYILWVRSDGAMSGFTTRHQWRLDRIKYCIGELIKGPKE